MKVLKSGIDFKGTFGINPIIGDEFLIKQSVATGWAKLGKVTKVMKSQIELEIINVIPTEDKNAFGVKNPFANREQGFFETWATKKRIFVGKKLKFFKDSCVEVGDSNNWNKTVLAEIIN